MEKDIPQLATDNQKPPQDIPQTSKSETATPSLADAPSDSTAHLNSAHPVSKAELEEHNKVAKEVARENPWLNLIFNIALPVLILNKGGHYVAPAVALVIAILFPLGYGLMDLVRSKKVNWISVLGLLNVLLTGSLALSGKTGIWFAVKEAAFPFLIGLFVWSSSFTKKPALSFFVLNPQAFDIDKMMKALDTEEKMHAFDGLVKTSTQFLSLSFLVSASLNFGLAYKIFKPIEDGLTDAARSQVLNEQIAQMTQWSFVVILVPSMIILLAIILYFGKRFKAITGQPLDQYFRNQN